MARNHVNRLKLQNTRLKDIAARLGADLIDTRKELREAKAELDQQKAVNTELLLTMRMLAPD